MDKFVIPLGSVIKPLFSIFVLFLPYLLGILLIRFFFVFLVRKMHGKKVSSNTTKKSGI